MNDFVNSLEVFRYKFRADGMSTVYKVYSSSMNEMQIFMKLHGFNDFDHIEVGTYDSNIDDFTDQLKLFKFRSNTDKELFNIISTEFLLSDIYTRMAYILNEICEFGTAVTLRDEFPIIEAVDTLIESLPLTVISDMDQLEDLNYSAPINDGDSVSFEDLSRDYLLKQLEDLNEEYLLNYDLQCITIEGYISGFISLMTDSVN